MPLKHKKNIGDNTHNLGVNKVDVGVQTTPVIIREYPPPRPTYTCSNCSRKFNNELDLAEHQRIQSCVLSNEKTYCPICDIKLDSKVNYRAHLLTQSHIKAVLA